MVEFIPGLGAGWHAADHSFLLACCCLESHVFPGRADLMLFLGEPGLDRTDWPRRGRATGHHELMMPLNEVTRATWETVSYEKNQPTS